MADNYLETRYEQVFGREGATVKHGASKPSLDTLLKRTLSKTYDASYKLHHLQAEAIVRSAESVFGKDSVRYTENDGQISLRINCDNPFTAGRIYQVMELKAAEMGLGLNILNDNNIELIKTI